MPSRTVDVYHVIADGSRRRLLELLSERELSVQQLLPYLDMSISALSQHLKVLLLSGLVSRRKAGRFRFYRANPTTLREVHDWTAQFERFWESRLDRLGRYLDDQP